MFRIELKDDTPNGAGLGLYDAGAVAWGSGSSRNDDKAAATEQPQPNRDAHASRREARVLHKCPVARATIAHFRCRWLLLLLVVAVVGGSLWAILGLHCTVR